MILKINVKYFIASICIVSVGLWFWHGIKIDSMNVEKAIIMTNGVAKNISLLEREIEKNQEKAMKLFKHYLQSNPSPTQDDLIKLSKKIGVTSFSIWSADGKLIQNTQNRVEKESFWKTYRKNDRCNYELNMKKEKAMSVKIYPLKKCIGNCIVNGAQKCLTSFHPDINLYLNVDIADKDIVDFLKQTSNYKQISEVILSSPTGEIIEYSSDNGKMTVKPSKFTKYSEDVIVNRKNKQIVVTKMFNQIGDLDCDAFFNDNIVDDYFYVLTVVFDL